MLYKHNCENNFPKFYGFTLAEILITLGIIGIVAAMTMPTLMTHIAKRKAVSKLTKAFAEINLAYKASLNDLSEPTPDEARAMEGHEYYETYWAPYIKASLFCNSAKECGYTSSNPWIYRNGSPVQTVLTTGADSNVSFITSSGVLYMIRVTQGAANGGTANCNLILIDINGGALPNQVGKDVFYFSRNSETGTVEPYGKGSSDSSVNASCSRTSDGLHCAEKIRRAGWKMDSSYPW